MSLWSWSAALAVSRDMVDGSGVMVVNTDFFDMAAEASVGGEEERR